MIKDLQGKDILCIYHGKCADGFTGAWVVNRWNQDLPNPNEIEFHPGVYGDDEPPINGRHVILIDFSYDRETMILISKFAASITVLDHHKTAEANMADLEKLLYCPATIIFDMNSAGCELAAEYFFPGERHPSVLHHIADRDLWNFDMMNTKAISLAVFSYEYTFENWDFLMHPQNYTQLVLDGQAINRKHTKDIEELFVGTLVWREIYVDGKLYKVATFNVPYFHSSELGNYAMQNTDTDFALCWYISHKNEYKYSLRSIDERVDVSMIAKEFGGGGHRNSSGCSSNEPIWL